VGPPGFEPGTVRCLRLVMSLPLSQSLSGNLAELRAPSKGSHQFEF